VLVALVLTFSSSSCYKEIYTFRKI